MKLKNYVLTGVAALSFGGVMATNQGNVKASSWHYGALPAHLRGTWYAKSPSRYNSGEKITAYWIKGFGAYSDNRTLYIMKWKYLGNHYYKIKYTNSSNSLHYFGRHKMTMNTFWHNYVR